VGFSPIHSDQLQPAGSQQAGSQHDGAQHAEVQQPPPNSRSSRPTPRRGRVQGRQQGSQQTGSMQGEQHGSQQGCWHWTTQAGLQACGLKQ